MRGPPPSFDELEAYLFQHPGVKLPVSDAKYYSLIAANAALMSEIEPASASGAEALAEVVTVALRMQYEPVEDEITLAGGRTIAQCSAKSSTPTGKRNIIVLWLVSHEARSMYTETSACN